MQFDVILNGLDNLEARRHVNRLCLAAERPLIESGTAGYLGQVGRGSRRGPGGEGGALSQSRSLYMPVGPCHDCEWPPSPP